MPKVLRTVSRNTLDAVLEILKSKSSPARVVTRGGGGPRGYPAAWKCPKPRFQSLVEEDCIRVLEFAPSVTRYETHPFVLDLVDAAVPTRYTPDLLVWFGEDAGLIEIKPADKLRSLKVAHRMRAVTSALQRHGLLLTLMLDSDAREAGLQHELKYLQRLRPVRGRFREDVDATLWDPLERGEDTEEQRARWHSAKQICDELLLRVMRRDPDELLPATNA